MKDNWRIIQHSYKGEILHYTLEYKTTFLWWGYWKPLKSLDWERKFFTRLDAENYLKLVDTENYKREIIEL